MKNWNEDFTNFISLAHKYFDTEVVVDMKMSTIIVFKSKFNDDVLKYRTSSVDMLDYPNDTGGTATKMVNEIKSIIRNKRIDEFLK